MTKKLKKKMQKAFLNTEVCQQNYFFDIVTTEFTAVPVSSHNFS